MALQAKEVLELADHPLDEVLALAGGPLVYAAFARELGSTIY